MDYHQKRSCANCFISLALALLFAALLGESYSLWMKDWLVVDLDNGPPSTTTPIVPPGDSMRFSLWYECFNDNCTLFDANTDRNTTAQSPPSSTSSTTLTSCSRSASDAGWRVNLLRSGSIASPFFAAIAAGLTLRADLRSTRTKTLCAIFVACLFSSLVGAAMLFFFTSVYVDGWLWCGVGYCELSRPLVLRCTSSIGVAIYVYGASVGAILLAGVVAMFTSLYVVSAKRKARSKAARLEEELWKAQRQRRLRWITEEEALRKSKSRTAQEARELERLVNVVAGVRPTKLGDTESPKRNNRDEFAASPSTEREGQIGELGLTLAGVDDWLIDGSSGMYYSPSLKAFYDPDSKKYFDTEKKVWRKRMGSAASSGQKKRTTWTDWGVSDAKRRDDNEPFAEDLPSDRRGSYRFDAEDERVEVVWSSPDYEMRDRGDRSRYDEGKGTRRGSESTSRRLRIEEDDD